MNRNGLSRPLPYLAVLTLACLNPINLKAEDVLISTSFSIIQVDESMLPALLTPMSHLVARHAIETDNLQDNSLVTSRAAVARAVVTEQRPVQTNQLNIEEQASLGKIELPRAHEFTPLTFTLQGPTNSLNFAMAGR